MWKRRILSHSRGRNPRLSPTEVAVLALTQNRTHITYKEVVQAIGGGSNFSRVLANLIRRKYLIRVERGVYAITEKGVKAVRQYQTALL